MKHNPIFNNTEKGDEFYGVNISIEDKTENTITVSLYCFGENNTTWRSTTIFSEEMFNWIFAGLHPEIKEKQING